MNNTTHEDLLVLAGYFAYSLQDANAINQLKDKVIKVNGKEFIVLSSQKDETGLDAFVVKNIETEEVSLIFAGSSGDLDWDANIENALGGMPVQYTAALQYTLEVQKEYNLKHITGHSLGGGLSMYAGGQLSGVEVVTLNPSTVPKGTPDPINMNMINYIIENDPLYIGIKNVGLVARIHGEKEMLDGGIYSWGGFFQKHNGIHQISASGEVLYSTASFIPFSIWQKNYVLGSGKAKNEVKINLETMSVLYATLANQRETFLPIKKDSFDRLKEEIKDYKNTRNNRQAEIINAVKEVILSPIFVLSEQIIEIKWVSGNLKGLINELEQMINRLPDRHRASMMQCAKTMLSPIEKVSRKLNNNLKFSEESLRVLSEKVMEQVIFIEQAGNKGLFQVVDQLNEALSNDIDISLSHWNSIILGAKGVHKVMSSMDEKLSKSIENKTSASDDISIAKIEWLTTEQKVDKMTNDLIKKGMKTFSKEVIDSSSMQLGKKLLDNIRQRLTSMKSEINSIKDMSEKAVSGVNKVWLKSDQFLAAREQAENFDVSSYLISEIKEKNRNIYHGIRYLLELIQSLGDNFNKIYGGLEENFDALKPYLKEHVAPKKLVDDICIKYKYMEAISQRNSQSFGEVAACFREHSASAVDLLGDQSSELGKELANIANICKHLGKNT